MIVINYKGMMGNNLFQYAFGRIIAEKLGLALTMTTHGDLKGFNNIIELKGNVFCQPEEILDGHLINFDEILNNPIDRKIILEGYFQRAEYYLKYKDKIKQWFHTDLHDNNFHINNKDIVVHIRRGNYGKTNSILDLNFYKHVLNKYCYNRVFVCGIGIDAKTKQALREYNPIYVNNTPIKDFNFIKSFNKIIQSTSTFCWWASFLSHAQEIYTPRPKTGYWGKESLIDLEIKDKRYIYIDDIATGKG